MLKKLRKIRFRRWQLVPLVAVLLFLVTELLSRSPSFVEHYYSQKFYPFIAGIISQLSSYLPFSIDDIFYLLLLVLPFVLVILLVSKKISFQSAGKIVLITLSSIYILFYVLWGLNYYRPNLNERLAINDRPTNKDEFIDVLEKLINTTNNLHSTFDQLNKAAVDSILENSYKNLAEALKITYPMGTRRDKTITFSMFYAQSGITGYFGPFFNEIHVNKKVLPIEYPFVLAHEKAHQFGITSEAEANFYAWLVCSTSNNQQIHYSASITLLRHFLYQAYKMEEYEEIVKDINDPVKSDFKAIIKHWDELRNEKMNKAASKVNDTYLKTNKIKGGIQDYRGVVEHVMNFSLDSAFQERHNLLPK
ncbi:DUF3810 domain-containing protein [uncultured Draconibacterium sp.]|uniref:DUF3810 domain-containing protein n=1 Tax=uncultured Draconibacterium sp. TaxID=1573823 RepID=UPI003216669D